MSTEFFRKYINIINENQEETAADVVDFVISDLTYMLEQMIRTGEAPRLDDLLDTLNDLGGGGDFDQEEFEAVLQQDPSSKAVYDLCSDILEKLDSGHDESSVVKHFMPKIKQVYQMAKSSV